MMMVRVIEAPSNPPTKSKLFVFSAADSVNPFSPQEQRGDEQKLNSAKPKEPVLSKRLKNSG